MNSLDSNIKKCQGEVMFYAKKLANILEEKYRLDMFLFSNPTNKIQESYKLCYQREEWTREDLKKAKEELEKAYELKYK